LDDKDNTKFFLEILKFETIFLQFLPSLKSVRVKAKMEDLVSFAIGGGRERERADWRKEVGQGRDAYSIIRDGSKNVQHRDL
jgi:hypothetical protein